MNDYIEALEKALILLEAANCPQCGDKSGAYYDNDGDVCQCQWCDEVKAVVILNNRRVKKQESAE